MTATVRGPQGPLRAVVFDWGGTLAVHEEVELLDLWRVAAERLAPDDPEPLTQTLVAVERAAWARTESTMRSARLMDLLRDAAEDTGLDVAEAVLSAAQDAHLDAWTPRIRHHDDAVPTVKAVRAAGLRTGLLSNTHWPRSFHEQFLQRDGLVDLIDARLYTCELDWVKPHPAPFQLMAERLGVPAPACLFVGDRPIDDVAGALGAGMQVAWVRNDHAPGTPEGAHLEIDCLADLVDALGL